MGTKKPPSRESGFSSYTTTTKFIISQCNPVRQADISRTFCAPSIRPWIEQRAVFQRFGFAVGDAGDIRQQDFFIPDADHQRADDARAELGVFDDDRV